MAREAVLNWALAEVRRIVCEALAGRDAAVFLFGSFADGSARRTSDIDVAIDAGAPLPPILLAAIRDALEESTVPRRVDVIDLATVDPAWRARIRAEGVRWRG